MRSLYSTACTAVPLTLLVLSPCVSSLAAKGSSSMALSTPISSTAPTLSPNETSSSLFESNTYLEAAVTAWEDDERCDGHFFATSSEQMRSESNFAGFYNETIGNLREGDPKRFRRLGEVSTFVEALLFDPNFVCSWQSNGCKAKPRCAEIVRRLNQTSTKRGEPVPTAELLVVARQVYFIIETLDSIGGYWHSFQNMVTAVHGYSQAHAADVVLTFTEQANPDNEKKCIIAKVVEGFAIKALQEAFTITGYIIEAKVPKVKDENGKDAGPQEWVKMGEKAIRFAWLIHDVARMAYDFELKKSAIERGQVFDGTPDENSSDRLRMPNTPIFQVDVCSFLGGGKANENAGRTSNMNVWLGTIFQALRGSASTYSDWLLNSKGDEMDKYDRWGGAPTDWNTPLAAVLSRNDMYQATQRMSRNHAQYENNMTQYFKETLVTAAWSSAVCYNKCVRTTNVEETRKFCKDDPLKIKYCPPDDELTMCQVQCLSRRELRGLEIDLHGMGALKGYGINMEDVAKDSYRNYIEQKDKFVSPADMVGSDVTGMDRAMNGTLSRIALPTCLSPDIRMGDYRKKGALANKYHQQFPFTCGEFSSDTYDFMDAMGLHSKGQPFLSWQLWAELQHIAPNNLALVGMHPAEHYLAMCELGIKMPDTNAGRGDEWKHNHHRIQTWRNASAACDTIKMELKPFMDAHDHDAANLHFCKRSLVVSDEVFLMERWHAENLIPYNRALSGWDVVGKVIAHMTQCNTWLKEHHPEEGQIKWRWDDDIKRERYM